MRTRYFDEGNEPYYVDRFDARTFAMVLMLLALTIVDGTITIELIAEGAEECNPVMEWLLAKSPCEFILAKYALTSAAIPLLLVFRNFTIFDGFFTRRIRVDALLPFLVLLYLILVGYQLYLFEVADAAWSRQIIMSGECGPALVRLA
jgi:hypothetical protein